MESKENIKIQTYYFVTEKIPLNEGNIICHEKLESVKILYPKVYKISDI